MFIYSLVVPAPERQHRVDDRTLLWAASAQDESAHPLSIHFPLILHASYNVACPGQEGLLCSCWKHIRLMGGASAQGILFSAGSILRPSWSVKSDNNGCFGHEKEPQMEERRAPKKDLPGNTRGRSRTSTSDFTLLTTQEYPKHGKWNVNRPKAHTTASSTSSPEATTEDSSASGPHSDSFLSITETAAQLSSSMDSISIPSSTVPQLRNSAPNSPCSPRASAHNRRRRCAHSSAMVSGSFSCVHV